MATRLRLVAKAALAASVLAWTPAAIGRTASFTIAQVLSAPFPSSLTAAPRGATVAWVSNARGVRNIWVSDSGGVVAAHPVTANTADDGYDLGDLAWSRDAGTIAFVRGQTLEDDGAANVFSAATGPASRQVWTVDAAGGAPRLIGGGHAPSFSPDGKWLVYLDKRQVLGMETTGDAKPHVLLNDLGVVGSLTWSPDGKRFAFVSQRAGHRLVGIYAPGDTTITWMAPSYDLDTSPVFSPDGRHVAFVRMPVETPRPFVARRAGLPWSIWVADTATGEGHAVWTADTGAGSVFRPTLSPDNLLWSADGHLVFPWEKTGWLLPYSVPATGGAARALASGGFEVAFMTLDPAGRRLLYASNQNDIDRLHMWTVDPAGNGRASALTTGDGIESYPQVAADGTLFALRSGAAAQLAPAVLRRNAWVPLAPATDSATFPATALVTPQSVTFKAPDGHDVHGQLFLPPGRARAKGPAVLFFHGGPPRQMLVGFHYMSAYSYMYGLNQYLASKGYVVLSVNYRGGIGYGLDYREAEGFGAGGGSETNDILGAVTYLEKRSDVDAPRIGVWGGSYGGLMTALALARASDRIAVGVDYAGVYDWAGLLAFEGASITDAAAKATATASSPIATIDRWRSPVLVVHGDDDRNVPFSQSTQLIEDLRAHNIPHETLILPNEVHDLTRYASWMTLFTATDSYLSRYLEPPSPKKP